MAVAIFYRSSYTGPAEQDEKQRSSGLSNSSLNVCTEQAFVTLATNDNYARGAMVLGKSLRNHDTSKKLVALIGPEVSEPCQ